MARYRSLHCDGGDDVGIFEPAINLIISKMSNTVKAKQAAAKRAVALIESGMKVGIGTGSTAALAVVELGRRISEEGLDIVATPTSFAAERLAHEHGIRIEPLGQLGRLDLAFDGADEVSPELNLIKGRGAAHTREKVVAASSSQFVVLVDESKMVNQLGEKMPLPVEVLPMAADFVAGKLTDLGAEPEMRMGQKKDGPVVTDQGMWILDATFRSIANPAEVAREISCIPGVLDHGLFIGMATLVLVGSEDGSVREIAKA